MREEYLPDETYRELQALLMTSPMAGAVIKGTGGLRKVRFADPRRNKGTRGGLRLIYYYWDLDEQIGLFTV